MTPTAVFGMPLVMTPAEHREAVGALERAWCAQFGRTIGDLDGDLDALRAFFDPVARGLRLRQLLDELPPLNAAPRLPEVVLMDCGEDRGLVTPEGRAWLELAASPTPSDDLLVIDTRRIEELQEAVLDRYRSWSRHRLSDVIQKRRGSGSPMLPAAVGIALLVLVNGSLDDETALRQPVRGGSDQNVDSVVTTLVGEFADRIDPSGSERRNRAEFGLRTGYALTEARRRLSGLVVDNAGRVYVRRDREQETLRFLGRELRRRGLSETQIADAFDALVDDYREALPRLSELGAGFERIGRTDRLRRRLIESTDSSEPG